MRNRFRFWVGLAAIAVVCDGGIASGQQNPFSVRPVVEGLKTPHGVALHPNGDIYVAETAAGQISVIRNGRAEPALAAGWKVSEEFPRWAIDDNMTREKWMSGTLQSPGPITISTNGTLFVAEQLPCGRILEFRPDADGKYTVAHAVPVPWLDQEFQWRDLFVDEYDRLFIVGADEEGSEFMKFGSTLMRDEGGDWWVVDFGPFADFCTFAMSDRQDVMILGDGSKGNLSWWEVNRHIMLGGNPNASGRAKLKSLALYPDGSFILGQEDENGKGHVLRMDPFSGQQVTLLDNLQSIGDIEMNRKTGTYLLTDPKAGRLLECTPNPPLQFNEVAIRQIVRSTEGMMGGAPSEAPAFMNNFFDRLQDAAKEIMPEDSAAAVQFNLSDIAGKMPIVAGRVRTVVNLQDDEEDPLESVEFFLLFPSKIVMTETAVSPSMSFFSAKRRSGKLEQTKAVFQSDVGVYRLSGTNIAKVASAPGGLHVPVVVCGLASEPDGLRVNLSFLGSGIYDDYYLTLFQGPREQTAKLVVNSSQTTSGTIAYDATFMDDATIAGMQDKGKKEQISNLLISGFQGGGAGANRSVGWLRLGKFPAQMTVAYGDGDSAVALAGAGGIKDVLEKKDLELRQHIAEDVIESEDDVPAAPAEGVTP